jgi:hypothetical protein
MKLFYLSAAEYIPDHELNGEGQIACNLLTTLTDAATRSWPASNRT